MSIASTHDSGRTGIIFGAIIGGLALAAWGLYAWREVAAPPMMQTSNTMVRPALPPADAPLLPAEKPAPSHRPAPDEAAPALPSAAAKTQSAAAPAAPIRVEHKNIALDPVLLAAWQAYRNGDYDLSLQRYGEVLRKDAQNRNPPHRDALLGMAAIAQQRSQDAIAAAYYSQVLALDPRDPDAHAGMVSLLAENGEAGAESRLKLLLAQRPEAAALHFALGNQYAGQSRWGEARRAYFNACKLEPDNAPFAYNLAVSLDHLGQEKLAALHYRRALQLDSAGNAGFDRAQTQLRLEKLTHP